MTRFVSNSRNTVNATFVRQYKSGNRHWIVIRDIHTTSEDLPGEHTLEYRPQMPLTPSEPIQLEIRMKYTFGRWDITYPMNLLPTRILSRQTAPGHKTSTFSRKPKKISA